MDLGQLRYFNKIVEHRSFTKAARACRVSQPALSQQIGKLEKELGQTLFDRNGRQIKLTHAGQILRTHADRILKLVEDAKRQIMDDGEHGQINVCAIPTIAPFLLPRILREAASQFPSATVVAHEECTIRIIERCTEGEIDVGIVALPIQSKCVTLEPLFSEELLLAVPANHRLASKPKITARDFAQETLLLLNNSHCLTQVIESFLELRGFSPARFTRVEQLETIKSLVGLGYGLSFLPQMAIESGRSAAIVYRSLTGEKPTRKIALCYNADRFQSQLVTNFLKALRECLDYGSLEDNRDFTSKSRTGRNAEQELPDLFPVI